MGYTILKIDGSVLTQKYGEEEANEDVINAIARVISKVWKTKNGKLIVDHGMGSFAHRLVLAYGLNISAKKEREILGVSYVHSSINYLTGILVEMLINKSVPAIQIPPIALASASGKKIKSMNIDMFKMYLKKGILPVTHGDMIIDKKHGFSSVSSDELLYQLIPGASLIVIAMDKDGILDENGRIIKMITSKNIKEIYNNIKKNGLEGSKDILEKIIKNRAKVKGKKYILINGRKPERLETALRGDIPTISTVIKQ